MKIVVVGAAGLLGQKLVEAAVASGHAVTPFDKVHGLQTGAGPVQPLDISDREAVAGAIVPAGPDWIFNTAAYTAVDASEEDREAVREINVGGVVNLLGTARACDARLLTLSTDYVFDGRGGPYSEDDVRNPVGFYGTSKAEMEDIVLEEGRPHLIVRTMVLYGAAPMIRPNFALWVLNSLREGKEITAVTDQKGNPTLASDLARILLAMAEKDGRGIYHVCGADRVSRYEFALAVARTFGLNEGGILPVSTEELGQAAPRPLESGFVLDRLHADFGLFPLGLEEGLERFHEEVIEYGI